jgi:hypothetical protein
VTHFLDHNTLNNSEVNHSTESRITFHRIGETNGTILLLKWTRLRALATTAQLFSTVSQSTGQFDELTTTHRAGSAERAKKRMISVYWTDDNHVQSHFQSTHCFFGDANANRPNC